MRTLEVESVYMDHGSIVELKGVDVDSGQSVVFATDARMGWAIAEALDYNEPVLVEVEPWQVTQVVRP